MNIITDSQLDCPLAERYAEEAFREARRIFHRTLASWASDLLLLRQRGLLTTAWPHDQTDKTARRSAA
jgi:hypothetical protein